MHFKSKNGIYTFVNLIGYSYPSDFTRKLKKRKQKKNFGPFQIYCSNFSDKVRNMDRVIGESIYYYKKKTIPRFGSKF